MGMIFKRRAGAHQYLTRMLRALNPEMVISMQKVKREIALQTINGSITWYEQWGKEDKLLRAFAIIDGGTGEENGT